MQFIYNTYNFGFLSDVMAVWGWKWNGLIAIVYIYRGSCRGFTNRDILFDFSCSLPFPLHILWVSMWVVKLTLCPLFHVISPSRTLSCNNIVLTFRWLPTTISVLPLLNVWVIENFQLRYVYIIELSIIEELREDRLNDIINMNYNREWLGIICWKLWILIMVSTDKCHHSTIISISLEFCTAIILLSTRVCH